MFFKITDNTEDSKTNKIDSVRKIAYSRVLYFPLKTNEQRLDIYLQAKYHKGLKQICKELITSKLIINTGGENNTIIVSFRDPLSDNLAALITYGNSEVRGSNILKKAFNQYF